MFSFQCHTYIICMQTLSLLVTNKTMAKRDLIYYDNLLFVIKSNKLAIEILWLYAFNEMKVIKTSTLLGTEDEMGFPIKVVLSCKIFLARKICAFNKIESTKWLLSLWNQTAKNPPVALQNCCKCPYQTQTNYQPNFCYACKWYINNGVRGRFWNILSVFCHVAYFFMTCLNFINFLSL